VHVPLTSSFVISKKAGRQTFVKPIVEGDKYRFSVKIGTPSAQDEAGTMLARGSFGCVMSGVPMTYAYIDDEANAGRMGERLMAVVAEGVRCRVYLDPTPEMEKTARSAEPTWKPDAPCRGTFASNAQGRIYGFKVFGDYFTARQLVALTTFSDLVIRVRDHIRQEALKAGDEDDAVGLDAGGNGVTAYAEAVSVFLAFALDKMTDIGNRLVRWEPIAQCPRQLFGRQAIPMVWDFAEANPLGNSSGSWEIFIDGLHKAAAKVFEQTQPWFLGHALQADAQTQSVTRGKFVSCDPPYYGNIAYADLSDFFYVWLRRALRPVFPNLLATISVPKAEELIAAPHRHGGWEQAEGFFLDGMTSAMRSLANQSHPEAPITIYYAFKQSETNSDSGTVSTGWVTFLEAVHRAQLQLSGTWPLRTENASRMVGQGANALASSIVLVCRKRPADAPTISRREFIRDLKVVLPEALDVIINGSGDDRSPVAPVDLSQAIIGPGMAVFSKYSAVLEADGSPMSVRTALQLINRFLGGDDFDPDTLFCLDWFEQHGWMEGGFGEADGLARSKSVSVDAMKEAGVLQSGSGKVRLLKWAEYPTDWDPRTDTRTPVWEALHQLIRALRQGGESASGALLAALGGKAEAVRQLAYRLYTLCERLGQAEDARAYNELITSWTGIETAAAATSSPPPAQGELRFDA
jgi:putative DNA methylase